MTLIPHGGGHLVRLQVLDPSTKEWVPLEVSEGALYSFRLDDEDDPVLYIGEAVPGSLETDSVWRIKKLDTTSGVVTTWAGGAATFAYRWDQRKGGGITYS